MTFPHIGLGCNEPEFIDEASVKMKFATRLTNLKALLKRRVARNGELHAWRGKRNNFTVPVQIISFPTKKYITACDHKEK